MFGVAADKSVSSPNTKVHQLLKKFKPNYQKNKIPLNANLKK